MAILLLLAGLRAQQQTVTFEHPCAHSSVVLEALGKEIGRPLKASGSVNQDYFLVRFDGVPVGEAMKKIAETLNAQWTEKDGILFLGRTRIQEDQDRNETQEVEARLLQEGLSRIDLEKPYDSLTVRVAVENALKTLGGSTSETPLDSRQILAMNEMSPAARYVARLCKEIGYETIVDTGEFGVVEYVPSPGQFQRALNQGESWRLFKLETQTLLESIDPATRMEATKYRLETSLLAPFGDLDQDQYMFDSLRVRRMDRFVHLAYYSKASRDYDAIYWIKDRKPKGIAQELLEQEGRYEPTGVEAALVDALSKRLKSDYGASIPIDPALTQALSDPVTHEPLDIFGSGWMLGSAKRLGKSIVALLGDKTYLVSCDSMSKNIYEYRTMWRDLGVSGGGYTATNDKAWITVRPRKRDLARSERTDRVRWRELVRSIKSENLSIEQKAGFYALSEAPTHSRIALDLLAYQLGSARIEQFDYSTPVSTLAVFGRLSSEQQAQAAHDWVTFDVAGLTRDELRAVGGLALGGSAHISQKSYDGNLRDHFSVGGQAADTDPMKVFANGFPTGSRIRVRVDEYPMLYQKAQGEGGWHKRIERRVGGAILSSETPGTTYAALFTVSPSRQLVIEIVWPEMGYQTFTFAQHQQPRDAEWMAQESLPKEFQEAAKLALRPRGKEGG